MNTLGPRRRCVPLRYMDPAEPLYSSRQRATMESHLEPHVHPEHGISIVNIHCGSSVSECVQSKQEGVVCCVV